jgi:hypothetical protein
MEGALNNEVKQGIPSTADAMPVPLFTRPDNWERLQCEKKKSVLGNGFWYIRRNPAKKVERWSPVQEAMIMKQEGLPAGKEEASSSAGEIPKGEQVNTVTIEYYDRQRKAWDDQRSRLEQGIMMYRFKYEEMCKQIKLLPAPPEMIQEEISYRDTLLEKAKNVILQERARIRKQEEDLAAMKIRLQEEEQENAMLRLEAHKPWWKKLFKQGLSQK